MPCIAKADLTWNSVKERDAKSGNVVVMPAADRLVNTLDLEGRNPLFLATFYEKHKSAELLYDFMELGRNTNREVKNPK